MYLYIKRILDLIISLIILVPLGIIMLLISLIIKLESKGSILFSQKRVGKDKNYFYIYKFRTMKSDTPKDVPTHLLENPDFYITRVGKFLRRTSLDELPQLINIIKGDMSFVGPRPALYNQYDLIEIRDKYRVNDLTPGLTGLAQVMGRDELSIEDKAKFDKEYRDNISFVMDIKIIVMTVLSVFTQKGYKEGR